MSMATAGRPLTFAVTAFGTRITQRLLPEHQRDKLAMHVRFQWTARQVAKLLLWEDDSALQTLKDAIAVEVGMVYRCCWSAPQSACELLTLSVRSFPVVFPPPAWHRKR